MSASLVGSEMCIRDRTSIMHLGARIGADSAREWRGTHTVVCMHAPCISSTGRAQEPHGHEDHPEGEDVLDEDEGA
eukprot:13188428-Alexandrium_andersonii.AAC.1